ncbi:hypothetical protein LPJ63_000633 [Coemansia sp. RSA 2711]|nr:hypothetical protein LPJ63_000633 [Coemansia sp. RSA 2711]KAJ1843463.1 hypothetical protein LPJ70_003377 [Coemansia sp. RSA 2708]
MDYVFWGFVLLTLVGVWYILALFIRRSRIRARLAQFRSGGLPLFNDQGAGSSISAFIRDYRAGLSSQYFDISGNISSGDSRPGLDSDDVQRIMEEHGVSFDKARLMRQQQLMARNQIDPRTGMPLDPKAVTFA